MKSRILKSFIVTVLFLVFSGCGSNTTSTVNQPEVSVASYTGVIPGEYDSKDTAIVTDISEINKTISFYNYELKKSYTLNYDSITHMEDKYGTALSVGQLRKGMLADILFLKSSKNLVKLNENASAFCISDITGFKIDSGAKLFVYKDDSYKITDGTVLLSGKERLSLADLDEGDSITITGIDTTIYSLTVDKGHGFLSLKGEEDLYGCYLEISDRQIELISPNARYIVPVGTYTVKITDSGVDFEQTITIVSNEELVLDLSEIEVNTETTGRILFELIPNTAKLLVDGKSVNADELQVLTIGRHKFSASMEGYNTETGYFNVTEGTKNMTIQLTSDGTKSESTDTSSENSGNSDSNETTGGTSSNTTSVDSSNTIGYYVFINNPSEVEVTYDGTYLGLTPLSLRKEAGTHTIILTKAGYIPKTYTFVTDNTAVDDYLSFAELELTGSSGD